MFLITASLKTVPTQLFFIYKTRDAAKADFDQAWQSPTAYFNLSDDYGVTGTFTHADVVLTLSDFEEQLNGQIERDILFAKAQIKGQMKASNDPTLKAHAMLNPTRPLGMPGMGSATNGFRA